ncbi:low molecular weight phosphatase family protein [Microbacterium testaceum]|uniref:protein-tyrosine-phosphatase n=1 Tax=Microbacterium testaceum TaxID=2033 RepID=A0A2T7VR30_MICTE|nr:low molecular weight phosphatase family protein [Microbacterium testaceum]PVE58836.1 low molecular weight phosphatase family protein [Microbacterium testaceum]
MVAQPTWHRRASHITSLVVHTEKLAGVSPCENPTSWRGGINVLTVLTVCTGNICRSPIAEQLLALRLVDLPVHVHSAGTRAREDMPMTSEAASLAVSLGVPGSRADAHRARFLSDARLADADLALAMARDHRREIVELNPSFSRKTFTVRELHRLSSNLTDDALKAAAESAPQQGPGPRFASLLALVAGLRGVVPPPVDPRVDDVIDPFGRSRDTYEISVAQIDEAVPSIERLARLAFAGG